MGEQMEHISKAELVERIRDERARLEATLARLDEAQMAQGGVEEEWSVKDILAHIAAWEGRMIRWVGEALSGSVPDVPKNLDEVHALNAQLYRENRDKALDEVLQAFRDSYPRALAVAENTPEEELIDPQRFEWRDGSPLWINVAANTWWHYKEHGEAIRAWLEKDETNR